MKCAEKPQKGQPLCKEKKKKKIERGGCHFGKKRIFWRINTQEKDDELSCDFEDDERKRERKEYAGIREREELFFLFVRVLLSRVFSVLSAYIVSHHLERNRLKYVVVEHEQQQPKRVILRPRRSRRSGQENHPERLCIQHLVVDVLLETFNAI